MTTKLTTANLSAEITSLVEDPKFRAMVAQMVQDLSLWTAQEWNSNSELRVATYCKVASQILNA